MTLPPVGIVGSKLMLTRRRVIGALVVAGIVVVGVFVGQAVVAARALLDARSEAEQLRFLVAAGEFDQATHELDRLRSSASKAHGATGGVLWDLGARIPLLGRNIDAVQTVARVLDTAAADNGPVALELERSVREGRFRPTSGRIDLAEVQRLTPDVVRAAGSIDRAGAALAAIRSDELIFPFSDLIGDLQNEVAQARSAANATATAFQLLPDMLGANGPRRYLLVVQNPAELRSTGGLPGSLAVLEADDGRVRMGWQGAPQDVGIFSAPVVKLPKDTEQQYGPTTATDLRDSNFTPDFPEAAQIQLAMASARIGGDYDGVIAVDPVALAGLLKGTGPVQVPPNATLTAANAVPVLLNRTYQSLTDPKAQDAFFREAARAIFEAVMSGRGSQEQAIKGLATAAGQHRVLVYSAHPQEQAMLEPTAVSGAVPEDTGKTPVVGMYINDSTAGKMDYYLRYHSAVSAVDCRRNDAQDLRLSVALESTMPTDFSSLSPYILGSGKYAAQGSIAFNLRLYAPYGGQITGLKVDGVDHSVTADTHRGHQVALLPLDLTPGQRVVVTADLRTAAGQSGDGVYNFTPGMVSAPNGVRILSACR